MRLVALLAIGLASTAEAADLQLWTGAELEARATKRIDLSAGAETRFDHDLSRIGSTLGDLGAEFRYSKRLKFGLGYRMEREARDKATVLAQRWHLQLRTGRGIGPVSMAFRCRFQSKHFDEGDGAESRPVIRNRLSLRAPRLHRLRAGLALETFIRTDKPLGDKFRKLRSTLGLDYRLNKRQSAKLFLRHHANIAKPDEAGEVIVGLGYRYRLLRLMKGKR